MNDNLNLKSMMPHRGRGGEELQARYNLKKFHGVTLFQSPNASWFGTLH